MKLRLESLSPKDTLRRGYAIVQRPGDGTVVSDASTLAEGDKLNVTVGQGGFDAEVSSVQGNTKG